MYRSNIYFFNFLIIASYEKFNVLEFKKLKKKYLGNIPLYNNSNENSIRIIRVHNFFYNPESDVTIVVRNCLRSERNK